MTSHSSNSTKTNQAPSLTRGQACITCRRKKMRCDGVRPFCAPCSLTKNPDHCEYTDKQGRTFTEVLEERLRLLKARVKELEERKDDSPVLLRYPYPGGRDYHREFKLIGFPAVPSEISESVPVHLEVAGVDHQLELNTLIHTFLPYAHRLHFVLHIPTFLQDMARHDDDSLRPHKCLISAVALWSLCMIGPNAEYGIHESDHLKLALNELQGAHSSAVGRHRMQAIQAEMLLALYFLNDSRITEDRGHWQPSVPRTSLIGLRADEALLLGTPDSSLELGERINLSWTVYALDRCWSVALGSAPTISDQPVSGVSIRSPMPMPLTSYERLSMDEMTSSEGLTVLAFIDGAADFSLLTPVASFVAAFVIGAALFEQATRVAMNSQLESATVSQEVEKLGQSLAKFNGALAERVSEQSSSTSSSTLGDSGTGDPLFPVLAPLLNSIHNAEEVAHTRVLAQSLGWAAVIQLHFSRLGLAEADEQCRSAVREIVRLIRSDSELSAGRFEKTDFFLGIVWLSSVGVVINELAVMSSATATPRSDSPSTSTSNAVADVTVSQQSTDVLRSREIVDDLETLLSAIRNLGETCPLIAYQLEVLEGSRDHKSSS